MITVNGQKGKGFFPHRNLLDTVANYLLRNDVEGNVKLVFPDKSSISANVSRKLKNIDEASLVESYNVSNMLTFMQLKEAVVEFTLTRNNIAEKRELHVHNNLLTDEPLWQKSENGTDSEGNLVCYPEALFTSYGTDQLTAQDDKDAYPAFIRPLYEYVVGNVDVENQTWEVFGPDPILFDYRVVGKVNVLAPDGETEVKLSVPVLGKRSDTDKTIFENVVAPESADNKPQRRFFDVYLSDGTVSVPFYYGTAVPGIEHCTIPARQFLAILKLIIGFEYFAYDEVSRLEYANKIGVSYQDGILTIPVHTHLSTTRLDENVAEASEEYFQKSIFIQDLFSNLMVVEDSHYEEVLKTRLSSAVFYANEYDGFVPALMTYFQQKFVRNWACLPKLIESLVAAGAIVKASDCPFGYIGNTKQTEDGNPLSLQAFNPYDMVNSLSFKRSHFDSCDDVPDGELVLAGYSRSTDPIDNKQSDHWVVAKKVGSNLVAVSGDRAGIEAGDVITHMFVTVDHVESELFSFQEV